MNNKSWMLYGFEKKGAILHFFCGVIPSFLLFLYGLYYLGYYENFKILRNLTILHSNHFIAFFSLSFLIVFVFFYLIFLSFRLLRVNVKKELIAVFGLMILCSPVLFLGPFFQPPSDPIFHAGILWDFIEQNTFDTVNRALITKSIFAFFYSIFAPSDWASRMHLIMNLHIFMASIMLLSSYISSRLSGLNIKWSIFSSLVMVLFFGTNHFGFITYYSLAPASVNISFYWLISALIFRSIQLYNPDREFVNTAFFYIFSLGILILPILFYNHRQEAGFLIFIYLLAFIVISIKKLNQKSFFFLDNKKFSIGILTILFFPNYIIMNSEIPFISIGNLAEFEEQLWGRFSPWVIGTITGPRVFDTLGVMGFIPLMFFLTYFVYNRIVLKKVTSRDISFFIALIPGLLPFWIAFVPFNLWIWMKGTKTSEVFWRLCYMTQFWISIAWIGYLLEGRINLQFRKFWNRHSIK